MKKLCLAVALLLAGSPCYGDGLDGFGLADVQQVSEQEAMGVRGQGVDARITSLNTNSLAFSIVDVQSGSVFNLNATSQMSGLDSVVMDANSIDGGLQSLGLSNTGGVQFGAATFNLNEFSFSLDGFASIGLSNQIGGAATGLNFTPLLP